MKVIIAGGRDYADYERLQKVCARLLMGAGTKEFVSGGAPGADKLGERFAEDSKIELVRFPAPWREIEGKPEYEIGTDKHGDKYWKFAGYDRNEKMAAYADVLIAFWNMRSTGTRDMIDRARRHGLSVIVIIYRSTNQVV